MRSGDLEIPGPRATQLLAAGAAIGLVLAAWGLLDSPGGGDLPEGALARVNETLVREAAYHRALAAVASDRRELPDESARRLVLDRLIEEELLVQRGVELGLLSRDRRVRADLVQAVIAAAVSEAEQEEPDPSELEPFYRANRGFFARSGRLEVRQLLVRAGGSRPDAQALARAEQAAQRLRSGEAFEAVKADLGDPEAAPLPRGLLAAAELREYLGPTAARKALELSPGQVGDPVRSSLGYHVLWVLARDPDRLPPLEEIEPEVRAELVRRAGDRALRAYLEELRSRADVRVAEELPPTAELAP